jgi:hypothetical protein
MMHAASLSAAIFKFLELPARAFTGKFRAIGAAES